MERKNLAAGADGPGRKPDGAGRGIGGTSPGKKDPGLYERLAAYSASDYYPFHMPGHKRRAGGFGDPFAIDITEIAGFDNLHQPEGILLEAQQRAARLYHAEESFYLVNGSTCGILAAVSACVPRGGRILMARNCHRAAYHAALLRDLRVSYLWPEVDRKRGLFGGVRPEEVRGALEREKGQIAAVLLTSPTYDGVVSDVGAIAREAHRAGAALIVDGAHGAHFGMHSDFPAHPLSCGADLVVNSLHKTLPSLTQTALLHVQGRRVDRERLRSYLAVYQTSSPSYVLMAGMDRCVRLLETEGETLFGEFTARLGAFRSELAGMEALHLVDGREPELYCQDYDRSRIAVSTERTSVGGQKLMELLRRRYHLELEMAGERSVTAIATVADTQEGFDRLRDALLELDREFAGEPDSGGIRVRSHEKVYACHLPGSGFLSCEAVCTLAEAEEATKETVPLKDSAGRISGEFVYLYPPGIPLLVPGERISGELLEQFAAYRRAGLRLSGMQDFGGESIWTLKERVQPGPELSRRSGGTSDAGK